MLKVFTTSGSITISDTDNNRLTVLRKDYGVEFLSLINNNGRSKAIYKVQAAIKKNDTES